MRAAARNILLTLAAILSAGFAGPSMAQMAVDWSSTVARVDDAVVEITTVERTPALAADGTVQRVNAGGLGSGTLVSADGLVLTAAHVVATADLVHVHFRRAGAIRARVVAASPADDVALLRLEEPPPRGVTPLTLGDSAVLRPGEPVLVIGAPLGIGHSVSAGIVSARHPPGSGAIGGAPFETELLQTDAAINQGNSGGPLLNRAGEVVGVVSYILSKSGGFDGIGFAVGSNTARRVLIDEASFWSGASVLLIVGDVGAALNLPQRSGFLVQRVPQDSAADRLGLRGGSFPATIAGRPLLLGGDVILAVGGIEVDGEPDTMRRIRETIAQRKGLRVTVLRRGQALDLVVP